MGILDIVAFESGGDPVVVAPLYDPGNVLVTAYRK